MAVAPAIAILCAGGVFLFLGERNALRHTYSAGSAKAHNRIDLEATVQTVDATNDDLVLRLLLDPQGRLVAQDGTPARTLTVHTSSQTTPELRFRAHQLIAQRTVEIPLEGGGSVTDYPLDHYTAELYFDAFAGHREVPLHISLREIDPFFVTRLKRTFALSGAWLLNVRVSRSRGTFILTWFIMIAMWALALAVLGAAQVLIRRRQGIVWPSLGWMAATLFALIGMRNAAPGSPPIGSLIDYASFFWAEAIIAGSLVVVAVVGIRTENTTLAGRDGSERGP